MNPTTRALHARRARRRRTVAVALAGLLAPLPAVASTLAPTGAQAASEPRTKQGTVATVRAATARYHDVAVAEADGYLPVSDCVESPAGAMGIHYMNPARAAAPIDLRAPAFLLYLPVDGELRLVGVEYFRADADQDLGTDDDRPSLLGHDFDGPMPGHGPGAPVHYDLHVWAWSHNPDGMFAEFNPALSC